ncbi:MAG: apolipoprotein N-acyltransferase [Spirochaetaceae bacterium]|jgi:apolipoprotein N-acyltransferase|nr:apolipoprotein N-acyltransferase [Spirochaetaceae bacterium]
MIQTRAWRWILSEGLVSLGVVLLGALLFAGGFPNVIWKEGLPLLAWIAYVPVFWLSYRGGLVHSCFWGALYGYSAYGLFNYWLSVFHPLAGLIVGIIYLVFFMILFPLLKWAVVLFPRRGYVLQVLLWVSFEYLRTLGFLGYPYGIIGYSQWRMIPLIQIADIFGVWGVSLLVVFPSAWLAAALTRVEEGGRISLWDRLRVFCRQEGLWGILWLVALSGALVYGYTRPVIYNDAPQVRVALIQPNTDPWLGGITEYRRNYEVLKRLSDEALKADPKPDIVVWSETAFVPRIYWHVTYRGDPASYSLVKELLDYLSAQDVPFVIGNDDARKDPAKNPEADHRIDYNAVMVFEGGAVTGVYRKMHLVPFTEHFPYKKQLPRIYEALERADTHFWEPGDEATVLTVKGLKFSSPICFEDTFGYISRDFVRNGAELIVNLSNDAWSNSLPAQMQHLAMAVFRAVENRRAMVRSTASGQTCGIDPNGRIVAMAEPFTETQLTVQVPVITREAWYTRYGDVLPKGCITAAVILLILGVGGGILRHIKKERAVD